MPAGSAQISQRSRWSSSSSPATWIRLRAKLRTVTAMVRSPPSASEPDQLHRRQLLEAVGFRPAPHTLDCDEPPMPGLPRSRPSVRRGSASP